MIQKEHLLKSPLELYKWQHYIYQKVWLAKHFGEGIVPVAKFGKKMVGGGLDASLRRFAGRFTVILPARTAGFATGAYYLHRIVLVSGIGDPVSVL